MIKILHISPGIDGGGIGEILFTYVKHMDRDVFSIDIASLATPDGHIPKRFDGFESIGSDVFLLNRHSYFKRVKELCGIFKSKDYDLVHIHFGFFSVPYLILAYLFGIKGRIVHSHGTMEEGGGWFRNKVIKSVLKPFLCMLTTDRFGCGIDAIKYLWGSESDAYLMTNAIEFDRFNHLSDEISQIRNSLNISSDTLIVGTIGRFSPPKNVPFIIDIIRELAERNIKFAFLWLGDGPLKTQVEHKLNQYDVEKYVRLLGYKENVPLYLKLMDVFILPSLFEGLPIVGIEAQAAGIPCLFSDTITREIKILPSTEFISIDGIDIWVDCIIRANNKRTNINYDSSSDLFLSSLYNIDNAVDMLQTKYVEIYKRNS